MNDGIGVLEERRVLRGLEDVCALPVDLVRPSGCIGGRGYGIPGRLARSTELILARPI
jgi:hypothetical protein